MNALLRRIVGVRYQSNPYQSKEVRAAFVLCRARIRENMLADPDPQRGGKHRKPHRTKKRKAVKAISNKSQAGWLRLICETPQQRA